MTLALACWLAAGAPAGEGARVLVVANRNAPDGVRLARYYAKKRAVPAGNVLFLRTAPGEEISRDRYEAEIEAPVRRALAGKKVDFILLMRGMPIRLSDAGFNGGYSVDAFLAAHPRAVPLITSLDPASLRPAVSPYFNRSEPFSRAKFGFFLVTRLDGYTEADARGLVDRSLRARPHQGPFLLDEAANRNADGYREMQQTLGRAAQRLSGSGFRTIHDTTERFVVPAQPLAGYAGWGSNDDAFRLDAYRRLRFLPGALAETFVSTSGRTFRPTQGGQSLIADLVRQGVTGVKGYVSEPNTFALARPEILFDRYTKGYTLAESFYMASPVLRWKDVVTGDPLCRPYRR